MEFRDQQCPKRAAGLSHTQDGSMYCTHCKQMTIKRGPDFEIETVEEPGFDKRGPVGREDGPGRGAFTGKQERDIEFMAWLYWQGRLD